MTAQTLGALGRLATATAAHRRGSAHCVHPADSGRLLNSNNTNQMKQNNIGIAVVGAGRIGTRCGRLAAKHPSVRSWRFDRDRHVPRNWPEQAGADLYTGSNEEVISHPDVTT
jgi:hypothetical protein